MGFTLDWPQIITNYLDRHYIDQFDDINKLSGEVKFPKSRKDPRTIVMQQERLRFAVEIFNSHGGGGFPRTVLDIGCYPGIFSRLLKSIYGDKIDLRGAGLLLPSHFKKIMAERYGMHFYDVNLDPFIHFQELETVKEIPFKIACSEREFDFVFGTEIIEHLLTPDIFISEIFRILRPGGKAFITTNNLTIPKNILALLKGGGEFPMTETDLTAERSLWRPHVHIYSLPEITRLFRAKGFKVQMSGFYDDGYDKWWVREWKKDLLVRGVLYPLRRLVPFTRPNIYLLVQKPA